MDSTSLGNKHWPYLGKEWGMISRDNILLTLKILASVFVELKHYVPVFTVRSNCTTIEAGPELSNFLH